MGSASSSSSNGSVGFRDSRGFTKLAHIEPDSSDEDVDEDQESEEQCGDDPVREKLAGDLKEAIKGDHVEKVCSLLEEKANVNHAYQYGLTPLHLAALHGSLGATKVLLCANANVCAVTADEERLTARAIAESEEHKNIVDLILQVSEGASKAVTLNIYDLGTTGKLQVVNNVLSKIGTGAFHVGVEVFGTEYSFGYNDSGCLSGVVAGPPRQCPDHTYRESVSMGETPLNEKAVEKLIRELAPKWLGSNYNLLTRNCTHFCDDFCRWLAVGPIPLRVMSLSAAGAKLHEGYNAAACAANGTANIAAATAMVAAVGLQNLDETYGISKTIEMSAEYNMRQLRTLDKELSFSETLSMSADYNQRKLREMDQQLKISETISMSADYNLRKLRELRDKLQILPGEGNLPEM